MPNRIIKFMSLLGVGTAITCSYLLVIFFLPSLFFYGSLHLCKLLEPDIDSSYFSACKVTLMFLAACVLVAIVYRRRIKIEHDFKLEK